VAEVVGPVLVLEGMIAMVIDELVIESAVGFNGGVGGTSVDVEAEGMLLESITLGGRTVELL